MFSQSQVDRTAPRLWPHNQKFQRLGICGRSSKGIRPASSLSTPGSSAAWIEQRTRTSDLPCEVSTKGSYWRHSSYSQPGRLFQKSCDVLPGHQLCGCSRLGWVQQCGPRAASKCSRPSPSCRSVPWKVNVLGMSHQSSWFHPPGRSLVLWRHLTQEFVL